MVHPCWTCCLRRSEDGDASGSAFEVGQRGGSRKTSGALPIIPPSSPRSDGSSGRDVSAPSALRNIEDAFERLHQNSRRETLSLAAPPRTAEPVTSAAEAVEALRTLARGPRHRQPRGWRWEMSHRQKVSLAPMAVASDGSILVNAYQLATENDLAAGGTHVTACTDANIGRGHQSQRHVELRERHLQDDRRWRNKRRWVWLPRRVLPLLPWRDLSDLQCQNPIADAGDEQNTWRDGSAHVASDGATASTWVRLAQEIIFDRQRTRRRRRSFRPRAPFSRARCSTSQRASQSSIPTRHPRLMPDADESKLRPVGIVAADVGSHPCSPHGRKGVRGICKAVAVPGACQRRRYPAAMKARGYTRAAGMRRPGGGILSP
jgi:hypothetical protein